MKRLATLVITFLFCAFLNAQAVLSSQAMSSLLTCSPGEPVYLKFGHTAIRVCDAKQDIDLVFNYGVFSFDEDNFIMHFVAGETDYQLAVQSYNRFVNSYIAEGRKVFEQPLNLDSVQLQELFSKLLINSQPENKVYRYNFIFDNCATRPYAMLDSVLNGQLKAYPPHYADTTTTFRQAIRHYTHTNSWGQLGIDLCFGTDADQPMRNHERLFLPEQLMNYVATVDMGGQRLTSSIDTLTFKIEPVNWWTSPAAAMLLALVITLVFSLSYAWRKGTVPYLIDSILYLLAALIGTLLIYLWFFSVHAFVQNNWNIVILNPLMWLPFICTLFRRGRHWLNLRQRTLLAYDLTAVAAYMLSPQDNMLVFTLIMALVTLHTTRILIASGVIAPPNRTKSDKKNK